MHVLPADPFAVALGEERLVGDDRTIRWEHVRYSVPPGFEGQAVWGDHVTASRRGESRSVDESFSIQPGTGGWAALPDVSVTTAHPQA